MSSWWATLDRRFATLAIIGLPSFPTLPARFTFRIEPAFAPCRHHYLRDQQQRAKDLHLGHAEGHALGATTASSSSFFGSFFRFRFSS